MARGESYRRIIVASPLIDADDDAIVCVEDARRKVAKTTMRANRARGEFSREQVGAVTKWAMFVNVRDGMTRAGTRTRRGRPAVERGNTRAIRAHGSTARRSVRGDDPTVRRAA